MANVLDRIMQKVDTDSKEADKAAKAYSNMLVQPERDLSFTMLKTLNWPNRFMCFQRQM